MLGLMLRFLRLVLTVIRLSKNLLVIIHLLVIQQWQHLVKSLSALLCALDLQVVFVGLKLDDDH